MTPFATVRDAYAAAWSHRVAFVAIHVALRLLAWALIAPALAGLVNLAVSLSSQSALTDQDIARFLLTPGGFVAAVAVLSVLLVAQVLGFALMAAVLRVDAPSRWQAAGAALRLVAGRLHAVLIFAGLFVLRVLLLSLPFVLVGLFVAARYLSDYDINYYLSNRPPEAVTAGLIIAALGLAMILLLLGRLSGWALALHLVLFDGASASASFSQSTARMLGARARLVLELLLWFAIRLVLLAALGLLAGLALRLAPIGEGAALRRVLTVSVLVLGLWMLLAEIVAGVALGALAALIGAHFGGAPVPVPPTADGPARIRWGIVALGLAALAGLGLWLGSALLANVRTEDRVTIIAHRGAAGSRPENTLASVEKGLEDGADWIEIDVQETADDEIVVVHDSDFMKLAGVDLKVWDATLEDLAGIDIGSWYDPAYGAERTPLLRDVLERARGRSKVLIELKYYGHDEDLENRVIGIVEAAGMADQVATMSLSYPAVQKMLALRPDWRSGVLAATAVGDLAGLEGDFVAVNAGTASPRLARAVAEQGKDLYVWTVNDPLEMSRMISMGADGLITDEPALARQVLAARAGLNTAERLVLWVTQTLGLSLNSRIYRDDQP